MLNERYFSSSKNINENNKFKYCKTEFIETERIPDSIFVYILSGIVGKFYFSVGVECTRTLAVFA